MVFKRVFLGVAGLMLGLTAMAQTGADQTVRVNGESIGKTVSRLTFCGDDVVLQFTDGTSMQADMSGVSIAFSYQATGIQEPERQPSLPVADGVYYQLNGQRLEQRPTKKGIYVVDGRKVVIYK